jgi:hypothetical protein
MKAMTNSSSISSPLQKLEEAILAPILNRIIQLMDQQEEYFKFCAKVDSIAKLMCSEMGLDENTLVICETRETLTPREADGYVTATYTNSVVTQAGYWTTTPAVADYEYAYYPDGSMAAYRPKQTYTPVQATAPPTSTVPRWQTFRRQAALQIASLRAHNTYMLTEA